MKRFRVFFCLVLLASLGGLASAPRAAASPTPPNAYQPNAPSHASPDTLPNRMQGCASGGNFLRDITIPDGTVVEPGAAFVKTWEVQNTACMAWDNTFYVAYLSGDRLGPELRAAIPRAVKDQVIRISVNLIAPRQPGSYSAEWALFSQRNSQYPIPLWAFSPTGQLSGNLHVRITVRAGNNSIVGNCFGSPRINYFYPEPLQIRPGEPSTLKWSVENADRITLQSREGTSPITNLVQNQVVYPGITTQYTLTAYCGTAYDSRFNTVNVDNRSTPPPAPQPNSISISNVTRLNTNTIRVDARYYYNNSNPPGYVEVQAFRFGLESQSVRDYAIPLATQSKSYQLTVPSNFSNNVQVLACLKDLSGTELVCSSR